MKVFPDKWDIGDATPVCATRSWPSRAPAAGEIWLPPFMRNLVVVIRRES